MSRRILFNNYCSFGVNLVDGKTYLLTTGASNDIGSTTVELLVKIPAFEIGNIIEFGVLNISGNDCLTLRQSSNKNDLILSFKKDRSIDFTISGIASDMHNVWTHLVITYNKTSKVCNIYKNGAVYTPYTITASAMSTTGVSLLLGSGTTYFTSGVTIISNIEPAMVKICYIRIFTSDLIGANAHIMYSAILNDIPLTNTNISSYITTTVFIARCNMDYYYDYSTNNQIGLTEFINGNWYNVTSSYGYFKDSFYQSRYLLPQSSNLLILNPSSSISIPLSTVSSSYSFCMWIKLYDTTTTSCIFSAVTSNDFNMALKLVVSNNNLSIIQNGVDLTVNSSGLNWFVNSEVSTNRWFLLHISGRSNGFDVAVNNHSTYYSGKFGTVLTTPSFVIGGNSSISGFLGEIGPIYMWNSNITSTAVPGTIGAFQLLYNNNYINFPNNLINYQLTEGSGSTLNDISGNNNNATLTNIVWKQNDTKRSVRSF